MALNYETLIHAASKPPELRTTTEINDFIFPWLKQSLKRKQGIFQKISDGKVSNTSFCLVFNDKLFFKMLFMIYVKQL